MLKNQIMKWLIVCGLSKSVVSSEFESMNYDKWIDGTVKMVVMFIISTEHVNFKDWYIMLFNYNWKWEQKEKKFLKLNLKDYQ